MSTISGPIKELIAFLSGYIFSRDERVLYFVENYGNADICREILFNGHTQIIRRRVHQNNVLGTDFHSNSFLFITSRY